MKSLGAIFQAAPEPSRAPMTPEETAAALRRLMGAGQGNGVGQLSKMFARPEQTPAGAEAPLDAKAAMRQDEALSQLRVGEQARLEKMRREFGDDVATPVQPLSERMRAFIRSFEEE